MAEEEEEEKRKEDFGVGGGGKRRRDGRAITTIARKITSFSHGVEGGGEGRGRSCLLHSQKVRGFFFAAPEIQKSFFVAIHVFVSHGSNDCSVHAAHFLRKIRFAWDRHCYPTRPTH